VLKSQYPSDLLDGNGNWFGPVPGWGVIDDTPRTMNEPQNPAKPWLTSPWSTSWANNSQDSKT